MRYRGGVQYREGYHDVCRGDNLSTVGGFMMHVRDILRTVGGYQEYRGGYLEYRGGYTVPWENIMSTVGEPSFVI